MSRFSSCKKIIPLTKSTPIIFVIAISISKDVRICKIKHVNCKVNLGSCKKSMCEGKNCKKKHVECKEYVRKVKSTKEGGRQNHVTCKKCKKEFVFTLRIQLVQGKVEWICSFN